MTMRLFVGGLAAICLIVAAGPAGAVDLATVERAIAKEPAYSAPAQYCLLVFGPDAKERVWLALAGDVLYVDRNGNGDLTEAGESVKAKKPNIFEVGDLLAADGKAKRTAVAVRRIPAKGTCRVTLTIDGKDWSAACRFGDRPQDAPILHFNGPLSFHPEPPAELTRGEKKAELSVDIGTAGLGKDSFATVRAKQAVPKGTSLVADIEFPNKTAGAAPIKTHMVFPPPGG
jgi:hypothetical protein